MSNLTISTLTHDSVNIFVEDIDEVICLNINGSINMQDAYTILFPYFTEVHNTLEANSVRNLQIDITELTFMNSSGIGALVKWLMMIPSMPDDNRYKVKIILNKDIAWQNRGLKILTSFLSDHIELIDK